MNVGVVATFSAVQKYPNKLPTTIKKKTDNPKVQKWTCHVSTSIISSPPVPCVNCPVCRAEEQFMQSCKHQCPSQNNMDAFLPADGKAICECNEVSRAVCLCKWCNAVKHAHDFYVIFVAQANANVNVQRPPLVVDATNNIRMECT
jgi:hypothetical protein